MPFVLVIADDAPFVFVIADDAPFVFVIAEATPVVKLKSLAAINCTVHDNSVKVKFTTLATTFVASPVIVAGCSVMTNVSRFVDTLIS